MQLKRLALCAMIVITLASNASAFDWCHVWGNCKPAGPPAWVPTFETNVTLNNGFGRVNFVNPDYFATAETAATICQKLSCAYVISQPCDLGGGPAFCSAPERMLVFKDIKDPVNAGILAAYYKRNPEDDFPGLAYKLIQGELDKIRVKTSSLSDLLDIEALRQALIEFEDLPQHNPEVKITQQPVGLI